MYGYYYKAGKSWEDVKLWEATKDNPQKELMVLIVWFMPILMVRHISKVLL